MADSIRIFAGPQAALAPFRSLLPSVQFFMLTPDADIAVLPFDDEIQDRLHNRFGTGDWPDGQGILLSTTDQTFAAECSVHAPLAFLQHDVDDGQALQSSAVWQAGQVSIGPTTLDLGGAAARRPISLRPINVALRALGIIAPAGAEEFAVFGLANFTSNDDIRARAWPLRA